MNAFVIMLLMAAIAITVIGLLLSPGRQAPPAQISNRSERKGQRSLAPQPIRGKATQRLARPTPAPATVKLKPIAKARRSASPGTAPRPVSRSRRKRSGYQVALGMNNLAYSWKGIVVLLAVVIISGLACLNQFASSHGLIGIMPSPLDAAVASMNKASNSGTAAASLQRLSQLDRNQYETEVQYSTWAVSTCSAASMTMVMNSYGHNYRVADVLKVESGLHEITPDQGLLEDVGIARTADQLGFDADWGHDKNLDRIVNVANGGKPVIVNFPPGRNPHFPGGHFLVLRGGDDSMVKLADSSSMNYTQMSHANFQRYWGGYYAILTPKA